MTDHLVTGGAGFIGSHLAERLLREGARVRILDDYSSGSREKTARLRHRYGAAVDIVEGDVGDLEVCRRAVSGVARVSHQAARASVPESIADPVAAHRANSAGTLNMLLAARDAGVKRFVYAGSSSMYGRSRQLPLREDLPPDPQSPYALSKYIGEEYARLFEQQYGLRTIRLRYFNVFGPGQDPNSPYAAVIPSFLSRLLAGERPVVYGDGRQTRDFVHVADVVEANTLALRSEVGGVFNIARGERMDLLTLLDAIETELGVTLEPIHEPERPGDVRDSLADIRQARESLRYSPRVTPTEGLRSTVAYFRELLRA